MFYFDPDGKTEKERQAAINRAVTLSTMNIKCGFSGKYPGRMDCADLVAASVKAAGFKDLRNGPGQEGATNGVGRIASSSRSVSKSELRPGDVMTFRSGRSGHKGPNGKYDHIGIVKEIVLIQNPSLLIRTSNLSDFVKKMYSLYFVNMVEVLVCYYKY